MKNIKIKDDVIPKLEEILSLYEDVGWDAYTNNPDKLKEAIDNSLKVRTLLDNSKLIGLARVVGDAATIIYIQDILILNSYQGKGLGSRLLKLIMENYKSVRQIVLLTDNSESSINFYEKNGLIDVSKYNCIAFMK